MGHLILLIHNRITAGKVYKNKFRDKGCVRRSNMLKFDCRFRSYARCELRTIDGVLQRPNPAPGLHLYRARDLAAEPGPPEDLWIMASHGHITTPAWVD